MKTILNLVVLLAIPTVSLSQDRQRDTKHIQKELDEARKKVDSLERELQERLLNGKQTPLDPFDFQVGQVGVFVDGGNEIRLFKVSTIVGKNEMIVRCIRRGNSSHEFILRGKKTDGIVDGKVFDLSDGLWKVTKTEKKGAETYYVVEPFVGNIKP